MRSPLANGEAFINTAAQKVKTYLRKRTFCAQIKTEAGEKAR